MNDGNLQLAKITNDKEWQAYRKLFEAENKKRGIEAEPLPEERPEPSVEVRLSQTIDKAIELWQRDSQRIKGMFKDIHKQLRHDSHYHYYQARSYLENTVSGAASIIEDTVGLSHHQSIRYFIDSSDILDEEITEKQPSTESIKQSSNQSQLLGKIADKGAENIAIAEQAICSFFTQFKAR